MKKNLLKTSLACIVLATVFAGCKKDKGETNEEEVITTMIVRLTAAGSTTPLVYEFTDPDGPGGASPVTDDIDLSPNTTYSASIQLLNETATPVEDITLEVEEESHAHRFYYRPTAAGNLTVSNLNNDSNGIALGTTSTWTTGAAGTGQVVITLRHYPADPPNKAADDQVDSAKSGTDVEATFNVVVN
ncbi:MAG: type 1 periplasmic binding fold superfamily protein [Chitinophagaceae bacterium]|nr:MAG: type 1 periplasmic binding fold superfamily protein [Chitinophagaceae bacterium]